MASKNGSFLSPARREMLLNELKASGQLLSSTAQRKRATASNKRKRGSSSTEQDSKPPAADTFGTGCLTCGTDDDHANLMLCEGCNDEYHTYCLETPLRSVPTGDWFCGNCKPIFDVLEEDGLDQQICALPPSFTSRFGEICWAQGGVGFGWWPACIYDPRLTVGNARQLARKNLGKRHLVYFFECHGAPFSVLNNAKLTKWEDGLIEDYQIGRAAKAVGKARSLQFSQALQAAIIEHGKPIEQRLEWNHMSDTAQLLPSPKKIVAPNGKSFTQEGKNGKRQRSSSNGDDHKGMVEDSSGSETNNPKRSVGFAFLSASESASLSPGTELSRRNLEAAIQALGPTAHAVNPIEMNEDGELYCSVLKRKAAATSTIDVDGEIVEAIGFVRLASRKTSTFADAREGITNDLDPDYLPDSSSWKFYVPVLGPVSSKQEKTLGPVLLFLQQTTSDPRLGDGTIRRPLKLVIIEEPVKSHG